MNSNKKVAVQSIGRGSVSFRSETSRLRRYWHKPGITKMIPMDELYDLLSSEGGEILLTQHLLIKDTKVREELGLSVAEEHMMSDEEMKELLEKGITVIRETVPKMYPEAIKRLAQVAVEMKIDNMSKLNYLKEKSGLNVFTMIEHAKDQEKEKETKFE